MSEGPVATGAEMLNAANSESVSSTTPSTTNAPPVTPVADNTPPSAPVQTSGAKPYAKHLEAIPEGLRPMIEPTFEEWDREVNKRFDTVHSQYQPYKRFIDAGVKPEQLGEAMDLMRMMVQDPQKIYEALHEHFGGSGQGQVDEPDEFDLGQDDSQTQQFNLENDPRFKQLEQTQTQIAQMLEAQQQAEQARVGEQWLDSKMSEATETLKSKGIDPDWDYILTSAVHLSQNGGLDNDQAFAKAVEGYVAKVDTWRSRPGANAPLVMPTSGGTPSTGMPPLNTGKDRRAMGVDLLKAAQRNG